jgi:hypothetical protein
MVENHAITMSRCAKIYAMIPCLGTCHLDGRITEYDGKRSILDIPLQNLLLTPHGVLIA